MKRFLLYVIIFTACFTTVKASEFKITVPEGATVYVGSKTSKHYVPFIEKQPVDHPVTSEGKTVYTFDLSGRHNYRVSKTGYLTHAGTFTPGTESKELEITTEMMSSHDPKEIDHDVTSNNNRNMADIFLNINAQGHLKLSGGDTYQLINLRNWEAIDHDAGNYFIEPDFHYTVVNENGEVDASIVTVNKTGLLTAHSTGTAIVLVGYDAFICASANAGTFFGALWPENTGVFVVTVDGTDSGITTGMKINEKWNKSEYDKMAIAAVDAELDVFYYLEETGGYNYTFRPADVTSVTIAQPTLNNNILNYSGFSSDGVTNNGDGTYTVSLKHGRNIVKLSSSTGSEFQVMSAKPISYTISNATTEGKAFQPGDKVSILFKTLYHPCNKLAGVYNMSAGIQFTGAGTDFGPILGVGQYTFASRAQNFEATIPQDFNEDNFLLVDGVIKVRGYGDHYGNHRSITLENGKAPNLNADIRLAYFGSIPDIIIRLVENPTAPTNLKAIPSRNSISLSWSASVDNEEISGYNIYVNNSLKTKVTGTKYTLEDLTPGTEYTIEVEAADNKGNVSPKTLVTSTTIDESAPEIPTGLTVTDKTETTLALSWEAPQGDVVVIGYNLYVNDIKQEVTITETIFSLNNLKAGTIYSIQVEAYNAAGKVSGKSPAIAVKTSDNTPPTQPQNLQADPRTTSIDLTWDASDDNVGVTGYNIYINTSRKETTVKTSYTIKDLQPGIQYTIEVEAIDEAGNGSSKAVTTVKTPGGSNINPVSEEIITVYPNPFTDYMIINTPIESNIIIYNQAGQILLKKNAKPGENGIDTSSLPSGSYIIKCNDKTIKGIK